jgi:hypothetical protein
MSTLFEIPLDPQPQRFSVTLKGVSYLMRVTYRVSGELGSVLIDDLGNIIVGSGDTALGTAATIEQNWLLDVGTIDGTPLVCGIPLLPGVDLLGQYDYLGIGGQLYIVTYGDPDRIPRFADLGVSAHLIFVDPTDAS